MIYVITGPTGSGKTEVAVSLANFLSCPIVNADAFQIYQEMDIGTAKIKKDDPNYKNHYLLDIITPEQSYSVKQYQDDFNRVALPLIENNNDIVICGGTGLYIRACLYDYQFPENKEMDSSDLDNMSNDELFDLLCSLDKKATEQIHKNNRKRVIRAIQIARSSAHTKSEIIESQNHTLRFPKEKVRIIFINPDRETLYQNINNRVDEMIANGLVEEVKTLMNKYQFSLTAKEAIGYKEIIEYLTDKVDLKTAIENIKLRTRHYAKRQVTFFKHQFEVEEYASKDEAKEALIHG